MIQPPVNNLLVKVKSIFSRYVSDIIKTSFAESNASDINPADYVTTVGEIVALPRKITTEVPWLANFSLENIRVGDVGIFSYMVVSSVDVGDENQKFANCFWYKGQEYWRCGIEQLFGVVRDGGIQMVNGYCMLEKIKPISSLILPGHLKQTLGVSEATITHSSNLKGVLPMDKVFYNPRRVQIYNVNDHEIGIIEGKHILGHQIGIS